MTGQSDSLNLAVATGVMLYEMLRQRSAANRDLGFSPVQVTALAKPVG